MTPRSRAKARSALGKQYPNGTDDLQIVKMNGDVRDWQIRCVCGGRKDSCNSGWMKTIEDAARPILTPLILGKECRLLPQDQAIIATWATLKSMVSEFHRTAKAITHHTQRKRLMHRGLPPERGWGVWIGYYERKNWKPEWISRGMLVYPDDERVRRAGPLARYYNANATTQSFGRVYIHVVHGVYLDHLVKRWTFSLPDGGMLFKIWPSSGFSIAWPGEPLTDRDAEAAAHAVPNFFIQSAKDEKSKSLVGWPEAPASDRKQDRIL